MNGEDHRPVGREQLVEILVLQAMGMLRLRLQYHQIDHVDDARDPDIGTYCRNSDTAAIVSSVGTSPAQAMTTSGSSELLLAHCQMLFATQWRVAESMSSHCHPAVCRR